MVVLIKLVKFTSLAYRFFTILLLLTILVDATHGQESIKVVIKGNVQERVDKHVYLVKANEDVRHQQIAIPISEGRFEHTFESINGEAFLLIFEEELNRGAFRPIVFFTEPDTVFFQLQSEKKADDHLVEGGALNAKFRGYQQELRALRDQKTGELKQQQNHLISQKQYHSKELRTFVDALQGLSHDESLRIYQQIDSLEKIEKDLTPEANIVRQGFRKATEQMMTWQYETFVRHDLTPVSLYLMLNDLRFHKENTQIVGYISTYFPEYAAQLEGHPYIELIGNELKGLLGLVAGKQIADFEAPDLEGTVYRLYPLIEKNKITLLNLWGSWCGPCIAKSRTMVPLLQRYGNQGFGVVGVAREYKNTNDLVARLGQESFDWVNLVDLDNKQQIWSKYGISNAAGMMVLLDQQGKILAVDPSANEVRAILDKLL